jgi:hypothetical protein
MLTAFWDSEGVLLAHFQRCGENVNSAEYCEVLVKLRDTVQKNCRPTGITIPEPIQPDQPRREL